MNAGEPAFNAGGGAGRGGGAERGGGQACASCKYQRRKCNPGCVLAPFFPPDRQKQFLNAHRLFGVSNIQKIIQDLNDFEKHEAMTSIIIQADARARDPVGGCYRIICHLRQLIEQATAELESVMQQIRMLAGSEAAAAAATNAGEAGFNHIDFNGFHQAGGHLSMVQPALSYPMPVNMMPSGFNPYNENIYNILGHNYGNQQENQGTWVEQQQQQNWSGGECSDSKLFVDPDCNNFRPEIIDMFDDRSSPFVDSKDSLNCSTKTSIKYEADSIEHIQEHDLKGAASFFTLTNFK